MKHAHGTVMPESRGGHWPPNIWQISQPFSNWGGQIIPTYYYYVRTTVLNYAVLWVQGIIQICVSGWVVGWMCAYLGGCMWCTSAPFAPKPHRCRRRRNTPLKKVPYGWPFHHYLNQDFQFLPEEWATVLRKMGKNQNMYLKLVSFFTSCLKNILGVNTGCKVSSKVEVHRIYQHSFSIFRHLICKLKLRMGYLIMCMVHEYT